MSDPQLLSRIEYRHVGFVCPVQKNANWLIYAGEDGSILVFTPTEVKKGKLAGSPAQSWVRLNQTCNGQGYWEVNIQPLEGGKRVAPLVSYAFNEVTVVGEPNALHFDDNKDNNSASNIYWGTKKENRCDEFGNAHLKQRRRERRNNISISLSFEGEECVGTIQKCPSTDVLTLLQQLENKAKSKTANKVVELLLHKYEWAKKGVGDLEKAMPEKSQKAFPSLERLVSDNKVLLPESFDYCGENPEFIEWNGYLFITPFYYMKQWIEFDNRFMQSANRWIYADNPSTAIIW